MVTSPLRVLLLTLALPSDEKARVPTHILQEIRHLAELPIELHVMTPDRTSIRIPGVKFHVLPQTRKDPIKLAKVLAFAMRNLRHVPGVSPGALRRFYLAAKKNWLIAEFLRDCPVDVVHSHWAFPEGTGGTWAAKAAGVPVIMTLRGREINTVPSLNYGYRLNSAYQHVLKDSLQAADAVTVASSFSKRNVYDLVHAELPVQILPNGMDLDRFDPQRVSRESARRVLGVGDEFLLFTLGTCLVNKRFDVIVKAMSLLAGQGRCVRCILGGDGEELPKLKQLAHKLGVSDRMSFAGALLFEEVVTYYAACDAFVFSSAAEGFCNVLLEAMAMARPVITTPVGMAEDTIEDGVNGLLVPFDRPDVIAEKVAFLMENPARAREIGENGRASVVRKFSMDKRVEGFYDLYVDCIARKGGRTQSEELLR